MIKYSRSEVGTAQRCPRQWYYGYGQVHDASHRGWEPKRPYLPTTLGLSVHAGMEALFRKGSDIDHAVRTATGTWCDFVDGSDWTGLPVEGKDNPAFFDSEQRALIEAFLRAWRVQFWDDFNNEFEVVSIEKELGVEVEHFKTSDTGEDAITCRETGCCGVKGTPILFQARCDLVVRQRDTGLIFIPDWKVVKDARDWSTKFQREQQTFSQAFAVEQHLREPVSGCIYWAFIKGDRREGRQLSPLVWAYKRELPYTGKFEYSPEYQRSKGWERFAVWEEEAFGPTPSERVKYWVNWLPDEVRSAQFCQSPPVLVRDELVQEWVHESSSLMVELHGKLSSGLGATAFRAHRSDWNCRGCFAREVCEGRKTMEEMGFKPRKDHHMEEGA